MEIIRIGIVCALLIVGCRTCCQNGTNIQKYDLLECLLDKEKYRATMSPNYNADVPLRVSVQIAMYDIGHMDDYTMTYKSTLYIRLNWTDPRLEFTSCGKYESLTVSGADFQKCWTPDLFFHHEREASVHSVIRTNEVIYIGKHGTVTFSARFTLKTHCPLDLGYYPFDKQTCRITVQSYASKADEMILEWRKDSPFKVQDSKVFSIKDDSLSASFASPNTDPVGNYSTLKAELRFERKSKSYEIMYMIPLVFFFLIAFSSFSLVDLQDLQDQKTIGSRISICTGALTSTVMLWAGIYAKLPPVPVLLKLDGWMLMHIIFIAMILLTHSAIYICCKCMMTATLAECAEVTGEFHRPVQVKVADIGSVQKYQSRYGEQEKSLTVAVSDGKGVAKIIIYEQTKFRFFITGSSVELRNIICRDKNTFVVTKDSSVSSISQMYVPQGMLDEGKRLLDHQNAALHEGLATQPNQVVQMTATLADCAEVTVPFDRPVEVQMTATLADCAEVTGPFDRPVVVDVCAVETVHDNKSQNGGQSLTVAVCDEINVAKVIIYDQTKFPLFIHGSIVKLHNIICRDGNTLVVTKDSSVSSIGKKEEVPEDKCKDGMKLLHHPAIKSLSKI